MSILNEEEIQAAIDRNIKEIKSQRRFLDNAIRYRKDINEHIASSMININQARRNLYRLGFKDYV